LTLRFSPKQEGKEMKEKEQMIKIRTELRIAAQHIINALNYDRDLRSELTKQIRKAQTGD
jgi:hypothetical protein